MATTTTTITARATAMRPPATQAPAISPLFAGSVEEGNVHSNIEQQLIRGCFMGTHSRTASISFYIAVSK